MIPTWKAALWNRLGLIVVAEAEILGIWTAARSARAASRGNGIAKADVAVAAARTTAAEITESPFCMLMFL